MAIPVFAELTAAPPKADPSANLHSAKKRDPYWIVERYQKTRQMVLPSWFLSQENPELFEFRPFSLYIRAYWAHKAVLDGTWKPPVAIVWNSNYKVLFRVVSAHPLLSSTSTKGWRPPPILQWQPAQNKKAY